jgi:hypothetical protein
MRFFTYIIIDLKNILYICRMDKSNLIKQLLKMHVYQEREDVQINVSKAPKDLDTDRYVVKLVITLGPEDGVISRITKTPDIYKIKQFLSSTLNINIKEIKITSGFIEYYKTEYDFY